jgi:hypothetical protein
MRDAHLVYTLVMQYMQSLERLLELGQRAHGGCVDLEVQCVDFLADLTAGGEETKAVWESMCVREHAADQPVTGAIAAGFVGGGGLGEGVDVDCVP